MAHFSFSLSSTSDECAGLCLPVLLYPWRKSLPTSSTLPVVQVFAYQFYSNRGEDDLAEEARQQVSSSGWRAPEG